MPKGICFNTGRTRFKKGHKGYWFGKKHPQTIKSIEKIKQSKTGKQLGSNNPNWKGGIKKQDGYIKIYKPKHPFNNQGYVLEHRLVMEKHLGRYLLPNEIIHHINEIKTDNRINNLLLTSHTKHPKIHKKTPKVLLFCQKS